MTKILFNCPMLQCLFNFWRFSCLWSESMFYIYPPFDLAFVIRANPAAKKFTIPLNPSIRVIFRYPTWVFPCFKRASALAFVFINWFIIRIPLFDHNIITNIAQKTIFFVFIFIIFFCNWRINGPPICSPERSAHKYFAGG